MNVYPVQQLEHMPEQITHNKLINKVVVGAICPRAMKLSKYRNGEFVDYVWKGCGSRKCPVCHTSWVKARMKGLIKHFKHLVDMRQDYKLFFVTLTVGDHAIDAFPDVEVENYRDKLTLDGIDVYEFDYIDDDVPHVNYIIECKERWDYATDKTYKFINKVRDAEARKRGWSVSSNGYTKPDGTKIGKGEVPYDYLRSCGFGEQGGRFHIHFLMACSYQAIDEASKWWRREFGRVDIKQVKPKTWKRTAKYVIAYTTGNYGNGVGRLSMSRTLSGAVQTHKRLQAAMYKLDVQL